MVGRDPTREERRHIERIRQENGLGNGNRLDRHILNLESALVVLSEQLYKKSTHFLLELIQNADDNTYNLSNAELNLTYRNRHLRIDCNETGFSTRNVEAICRVGDSTKKDSKGASGYVGEKGIGFKSVFTVADVVWISSGKYSFKFDKNQPLGMIAPIWERFPEEVKPGYTSMLLRLSDECNVQEIIDEISSLDPRMLMFLRRLKRINVDVHREGSPVWESRLRRTDGMFHDERGVGLIHNEKTMNYIVTKHKVEGMPAEPKRTDITVSEILLAFPIDEKGDSKPEPQQVYAFLPVADYGFKFLLHADWLLPASREDILASSLWNQRLRKAFVDAFIAVAKNNQLGVLQRIWPRYLPINPSGQSFLEQARKDILHSLQNETVLQSHCGQFVKPSTLTFVSKDFTDSQGLPLTLWSGTERRYLSNTYQESEFDSLKELGVKKMTPEAFLEDLSAFAVLDVQTFRYGKSEDWHRRLAEVLIKLTMEEKHKAVISALELVPLSNTTWISPSKNNVFLPPEGETCEIPGGLRVHLVSMEAAHDHKRRLLFSSLGIQALSVHNLCTAIADTHRSSRFDAAAISRHDLVAQVVFLFQADWRDPDNCSFWFVTEDDTRRLSTQLYLDSDLELSATAFFAGHRERFQFVHSSYLSAVPHDNSRWILWMCRFAGVSLLPRLIQFDIKTRSFDMCADFRFITKNYPSSQWLLLFRDHWNDYAGAFDENHLDYDLPLDLSLMNLSRVDMRAKLGRLLVDCKGGKKARLDESYLPVGDLIAEAKECVAFLDVPEPDDPRWAKLELLNVGMKGSVAFYMRCLEYICTSPDPSVQESASAFLEQIQARCSEDEELVRKKFVKIPLILVPASSPGRGSRWVRAQECLWAGPECFRSRIPLKNIYPEFRKLFRDVLKLRDSIPIDLVHEAKSLEYGDKLLRIKDLFRLIESSLEKDENESCFDVLCEAKIFPVFRLGTTLGYDCLATSRSAKDWFIADGAHLESSFRGKVDILAFTWDEIAKIPLVLKKLGTIPRKLSKAARSIPELIGSVVKNERCQQSWREKVEFIMRLIPEKEPSRSRVLTQLRNLEVFTADRVVQKWSLKTSACDVEGQSSPGQVVLSTEGDIFQIYLASGYLESVRNPKVLVEQLSDFCGIPKDYGLLLNTVLTESDHSIIESDFQRDAIPALSLDNPFADPDSDDDDLNEIPDSSAGRAEPGVRVDHEFLRSRAKFLVDNIGNIFVGVGGMPNSFASAARNFSFTARQSEDTPASSSAGSVHTGDDAASQAHDFNMGGLRILAVRNASRTSANARQAVVDETLAYEGELFVTILLERILEAAYSPEEHWTSKLRTRSGYSHFEALEGLYSSFTLPDGQCKFTEWLVNLGHEDAVGWRNSPPVYHLEVKTTAGHVDSDFALTNAEFERARRYTIPDSSQGPPTQVSILLRVFNIRTKVNLLILRDPWALYLDGQLQVRTDGFYRAQVLSTSF